ncbi:MAG: hypothetical protein ACFE0S_00555 [Rhodospirillales bacterium]
MGPVLEQHPVRLDQTVQILLPVTVPAARQDHVMGAFDPLNGIDLNEPEFPDQVQQPVPAQAPARTFHQPLQIEDQPARFSGGDVEGRVFHGA